MIKKYLRALITKISRVQNRELKSYIAAEFRRRDLWKVKNAEVKRLAKGKKIWVIKAPFPDSDKKFAWGEYNFSRALKRELESLGYYVIIEEYENWYCEVEADVVLVLRGPREYHPDRRNEKCKYILWHVTHPNVVSAEEYELYDWVYVNSLSYAEMMKGKVSVPVEPLLVCVDTDIFYPQEVEVEHDIVFVGNPRGFKRKFVTWCEKHKIPLHIWGGMKAWRNLVKRSSCVTLHGLIDNNELPNLYRKSRVMLNDHYEDMRELGFFNNRMLEVLCCGRPLLSDYNPEYELIFGDSIVYYKSEEEFIEKLQFINENYEEQRQKVLEKWPMLKEEFSFSKRAKDLDERVKAWSKLV